MRLTSVRVTDFQSVRDSGDFEIGDITCLVGKNEAGKTAILKALYKLNPIVDEDGAYETDTDYPRSALADYEQSGQPKDVVRCTYVLDEADISAIEDVYGKNCLKIRRPAIVLSKGYETDLTVSGLEVDVSKACRHLIKSSELSANLRRRLLACGSPTSMRQVLAEPENDFDCTELEHSLQKIDTGDMSDIIYKDILCDRIPKFLYFSEYYQLTGQENIHQLLDRRNNDQLLDSDYPLFGLLELARLNLENTASLPTTEQLLARLEAAENQLTTKVLAYWSQNRHLRMSFDIRPGQPDDPPGMQDGMNIWGRVKDTRYGVSTQLGTRSRGFVWFFSFLAWYTNIRKQHNNIILLLDEPGLSLHAKAQEDLLRYFERELMPHHQLIYTTHSPFMIDPHHFDRVRIVQDRSIDSELDDLPEDERGTKVVTDVMKATDDSLFPLQGALGYEIHQTLFVGPNSLLIEGVSDLIFIQVISQLLQNKGRRGLDGRWTVTPVGGASRVPAFVALLGSQSNINVAVLLDYHKRDRQSVENLYKSKLLKKQQIFTYADFTSNVEADVEDMFDPEFYLKLVNGAYRCDIELSHLTARHPRIVVRLAKWFEKMPLSHGNQFSHYPPAQYLSRHADALGDIAQEDFKCFQDAFDRLNRLLPGGVA